jgi:hypothetical protein
LTVVVPSIPEVESVVMVEEVFVIEVEGSVDVELVVLVRVEVDDFVVVNPIDCKYKLTN